MFISSLSTVSAVQLTRLADRGGFLVRRKRMLPLVDVTVDDDDEEEDDGSSCMTSVYVLAPVAPLVP